jgi:hypothetical protein
MPLVSAKGHFHSERLLYHVMLTQYQDGCQDMKLSVDLQG